MALSGSYVDMTEADTYLQGHPAYATWSANGTEAHLRTATRRIDALPLLGKKADSSQDREFPREYWDGSEDSAVPDRVKNAVIEEALALVEASDTVEGGPALSSVSVDGLSFTFAQGAAQPEHAGVGLSSPTAYRLLLPYISQSREMIRN